jgi:DnaJ-class molecular chaperone
MSTHYESLHVNEDAPEEVIRAAYRALSLKHHPDKTGDRPHSQRRMQVINDAYAVLSDTVKRADYDGSLRRARNPQPQAQSRMTAMQERPQRVRQSMVSVPLMKGTLGWLSDARVVLPAVALIWLVIYWVLARK